MLKTVQTLKNHVHAETIMFLSASCSSRSFSSRFSAACRPALLWRTTMISWLCSLLCSVCCFLTKTSSCAPLSPSSGTPPSPTQSASLTPTRSGENHIWEGQMFDSDDWCRLHTVVLLNSFLFSACGTFTPANQISVGTAHSNLVNVSIFFKQTNPEPSEAEDSDHSSSF